MLVEREEVWRQLLRCPKTGCRLTRIGNRLIADSDQSPNEYEIIGGYPVLIDFDRSVVSHDAITTLSSAIPRPAYRGFSAIIKRLVSPPKHTTSHNVQHILRLLADSKNPVPRVLIIGGGAIGQGMEPFYRDPRIAVVAFDIYAAPTIQFIADAHQIPLPNTSFDAVIIQAVLEHVLEPATVVAEIFRVLKPTGIVYAETPFLQHVHEGAYDFTRFTESGHRYLFKQFDVIASGASAGAGTQLLWSIEHFFRGLCRSRMIGKIMKLCFFWLQHVDRFIPESYNIDAASGVFFLGTKRAAPITAKDVIAQYQGAQR